MLEKLPATERDPAVSEYNRDAFGEAWADIDDNGCDQRDDVLRRDVDESKPFTTGTYGSCEHDMLSGTWHDPYTGHAMTFDDLKAPEQAQAVQIDHIVPLAETWRSGAHSWPSARRERYANDLGVLVASDGPTNMSKGDDDPAAWRPRASYQCTYAKQWIRVKTDWNLAVDDSEKTALRRMLSRCR